MPNVGAKTLRAFALLSELLAGTPPSWRDPARFAFAHGGKDGIPFPVDRRTYDRTAATLEEAVRRAKIGEPARLQALRRLHSFVVPARRPVVRPTKYRYRRGDCRAPARITAGSRAG